MLLRGCRPAAAAAAALHCIYGMQCALPVYMLGWSRLTHTVVRRCSRTKRECGRPPLTLWFPLQPDESGRPPHIDGWLTNRSQAAGSGFTPQQRQNNANLSTNPRENKQRFRGDQKGACMVQYLSVSFADSTRFQPTALPSAMTNRTDGWRWLSLKLIPRTSAAEKHNDFSTPGRFSHSGYVRRVDQDHYKLNQPREKWYNFPVQTTQII